MFSFHDFGFNPRARVGRDSKTINWSSRIPLFQSTRPRGARPELLHFGIATVQFQSTRPRGARRQRRHRGRQACRVSIHAPAWGATTVPRLLELMAFSFNPRARVGRD